MANEDPGAERLDLPEWDVAASHGPRGTHAFRPGRVLVDALAWRLRSDEAGERLARLLGRARALELMVTGKLLGFEDAAGLGLVNELFEADGFRERALEYAAQFVPPNRAARAVGSIKRAVCSGLEAPFSEGVALERELQQQLFLSEDATEGIAANVEKRKASFRGR